jgi:NADPH:quinone reductase-like Zn-dependent oxidoreductase
MKWNCLIMFKDDSPSDINMKAIVFDQIGAPLDVLQLADVPIPEIGDNEVLVQMIAASINPGDFLFIQNLYPDPKKPHFPQQIAGNHGAGVIAKVGKEVALKPGTLVAFSYYNTWAEYTALPAEWLIPLPSNYPIEKAGQLVNPITAWDLLDQSRVEPGQWLAVTAGHSTVATMVLQFAKLKKVNVICIVRRRNKDLDLKALGASAVIELSSLSENVGKRVMEITENNGVNGVIDCVGGALLGELLRSTALGAQIIIYGGYSSEKFELHNFDILMKGSTIKSYVYRYFFTPPPAVDRQLLQEIADVSGRADFTVPLAGIHPLEDFRTAIYESVNHPENGKRFFRMQW